MISGSQSPSCKCFVLPNQLPSCLLPMTCKSGHGFCLAFIFPHSGFGYWIYMNENHLKIPPFSWLATSATFFSPKTITFVEHCRAGTDITFYNHKNLYGGTRANKQTSPFVAPQMPKIMAVTIADMNLCHCFVAGVYLLYGRRVQTAQSCPCSQPSWAGIPRTPILRTPAISLQRIPQVHISHCHVPTQGTQCANGEQEPPMEVHSLCLLMNTLEIPFQGDCWGMHFIVLGQGVVCKCRGREAPLCACTCSMGQGTAT